MRTDRKMLAFSPSMPKTWKKLSFKVLYQGAILSVVVDKKTTTFKTDGKAITAKIYGKEYSIDGNGVEIAIPDFYIAK
jgi:trehalose/maltose hydrolase-like predicted phosphorylase